MKKKILAGLLSAMMVVSLAACGSSETGATTTDSKSETTANTADGTAAAATDAQGGYEGKEVKVWIDRKSTRLNSSHSRKSRMPSSA